MKTIFIAVLYACIAGGECVPFIDTTTVHTSYKACMAYNQALLASLVEHNAGLSIVATIDCAEFQDIRPAEEKPGIEG